jgi:3'5'-cyclic nucleotide phosphodiesterase
VEQELGLEIWHYEREKLFALSVDLAFRVGIHRTLRLSLATFCTYIEALADQYVATNTYHNFTHATDVLLVLCHLLLECNGASRMTDLEVAACFLAAHAHDVGHPGTNNGYQIAAKTPLGEKYGANATLETYSADLGQQLLEQHGILAALNPQERTSVLSTFRSSILGTDMAQHSSTCSALKHLPNDYYTQNYPPKRPGRTTFSNGDFTHALSLPALLLHAADISGASRQTAGIWLTRSVAVTREFVYQGDCERAKGIRVTEAFDRNVLQAEGLDGFQRRENEFTAGLVLPYFRDVERVWSRIEPLRIAIEDNLEQWQVVDRDLVSKLWATIFV